MKFMMMLLVQEGGWHKLKTLQDKGMFLHDVTSYWRSETMKSQPYWWSKPTLWGLNSFLMQILSLVSINKKINMAEGRMNEKSLFRLQTVPLSQLSPLREWKAISEKNKLMPHVSRYQLLRSADLFFSLISFHSCDGLSWERGAARRLALYIQEWYLVSLHGRHSDSRYKW